MQQYFIVCGMALNTCAFFVLLTIAMLEGQHFYKEKKKRQQEQQKRQQIDEGELFLKQVLQHLKSLETKDIPH